MALGAIAGIVSTQRTTVAPRAPRTAPPTIAPSAPDIPLPGAATGGGGVGAGGISTPFFFLTAAVLAGIGLIPPLLSRRLRLADELGPPLAYSLIQERPG